MACGLRLGPSESRPHSVPTRSFDGSHGPRSQAPHGPTITAPSHAPAHPGVRARGRIGACDGQRGGPRAVGTHVDRARRALRWGRLRARATHALGAAHRAAFRAAAGAGHGRLDAPRSGARPGAHPAVDHDAGGRWVAGARSELVDRGARRAGGRRLAPRRVRDRPRRGQGRVAGTPRGGRRPREAPR